MAGLGAIWRACWHPDGKGRVVRTFQDMGQYVEPLRGGNEPSLGRQERESWLGWSRDLCRVSWDGGRVGPSLLQTVNTKEWT